MEVSERNDDYPASMLLPARKQPLLEGLYAAYGRRLLRRSFAEVRVGGAPWPTGDGPVIAYANHGAWWDPVLAVFLSHDVFRRDGYGLMDGTQLVRYPFFRRVGCFGVTSDPGSGARSGARSGADPGSGKALAIDDARAVGEYATGLLQGGTRRALWLFPQGVLLPSRAPLHFRSGLARISRSVPEARLVPVAIRYEFRAAARPACVVRVGPPSNLAASDASLGTSLGSPSGDRSSAVLTRHLERALTETLVALDADLVESDPVGRDATVGDPLARRGYEAVLTGGATVSRIYDRTLGRLVRRHAS